jgi:hypothetical protein
MTNRVVVPAGNRFLGSLKGLQIRAPLLSLEASSAGKSGKTATVFCYF